MMNQIVAPRKSLLTRSKIKETWPMHLMMLGPIFMIILFSYVPMVGIVIAFQDYIPTKGFFGSEWLGWENFDYLFTLPDIWQIIGNTLTISVIKIITTIGASIIFALLISEVKSKTLNKLSQSVILFPWFISWAILGNIFKDAFSLNGAVNQVIMALGGEQVFFFGDNQLFRSLLIGTNIWKDLGYNMVILLTAISGIDPTLYEAATIDGANRFQRIWYITLPGMINMIAIQFVLRVGAVMEGGFDQVFNLYTAPVYETGDIIDTYIYRLSFVKSTGINLGFTTAVGLFKNVINFILLMLANGVTKALGQETVL